MKMAHHIFKNIPLPIKNLIKRVRDFLQWDPWQIRSWSQEGEDILLQRIFGNQYCGFFVDVGAHHPKRFSNTYALYRKGWRGINIDPLPGSKALFDRIRPQDTNLEIGITSSDENLNYYMFNDSALNGFSETLSKERDSHSKKYKITKIISIATKPLADVLKDHAPQKSTIDLLTVDAEGRDLDVLKSNDWTMFSPSFIIVEILNSTINDLKDHETSKFLFQKGYIPYAKLSNSVFFVRA